MHRALDVDVEALIDARIAQIRADFDFLMMKWTFIYMIFTFALVMLLLLPTLRGPALVLFLGGSAGQAYVVWRM
jgi:hypothetical protein